LESNEIFKRNAKTLIYLPSVIKISRYYTFSLEYTTAALFIFGLTRPNELGSVLAHLPSLACKHITYIYIYINFDRKLASFNGFCIMDIYEKPNI